MIQPSASVWLEALASPAPGWRRQIGARYAGGEMPTGSVEMLRAALERFVERFGDTAARVFRAPGRVNLRGMHVDTHGGFLNLMSHQREIVVVFSPNAPGRYELVNTSPEHAPVSFDTANLPAAAVGERWEAFLAREPARRVQDPAEAWAGYVVGAALRAEWAARAPLMGLRAVVAGNIPQGAALSSSAALCVAAYGAICAQNGLTPSPEDWILAARDAEWHTGARTGTSDQAASVLCRPGEICNVALLAEDFSIAGARCTAFPAGHTLLVINSHTRRSLSGAEKVAYTKNRFAYSMALRVFQREWPDPSEATRFDRLSNIQIHDAAMLDRVYDTLLHVPQEISLDALQERYGFHDIEAEYQRYFSDMPDGAAPVSFDLRGPLLYGLAESERAREFIDLIATGDIARAGAIMVTGHNGDRVSSARRVSESALRAARTRQEPITALCGDYGASSPALDALVDAALRGGALGACLTGAGIAGCVIALCEDKAVAGVRREVAKVLLAAGLSEAQAQEAVVPNLSSAGAGELPWPM